MGSFWRFIAFFPAEEQSLCYNPHLVLSEPAFASLLQLLKQDYQVVPLEDLLVDPSGNGGHPKVAITFDDGWEDNYRIAFPHLLAHDMPATIFACTGLLDTLQLLPEERFARLWSQCSARSTLDELVVDLNHWGMGKSKNRHLRPRQQYWSQELKRMPLSARLLLLDHLEQRYQMPTVRSRRFLTWEQVRIMTRTGLIRMGAHTSRHATFLLRNRSRYAAGTRGLSHRAVAAYRRGFRDPGISQRHVQPPGAGPGSIHGIQSGPGYVPGLLHPTIQPSRHSPHCRRQYHCHRYRLAAFDQAGLRFTSSAPGSRSAASF